MSTLLDILKKDSKGTFHWLETANDIETAITRVMQLSSESKDEFVVFRETDLKVVATSKPIQSDRGVPQGIKQPVGVSCPDLPEFN